ncbi:hypothetical protein D3C85_1705480 [compost metagenome]
MIGPVQEKDTKASVPAIKNNPAKPPLSELASILFTHDEGKVISNAPKKEMAKIINNTKKRKLNTPLVERLFSASAPKTTVTNSPKTT